MARRSDDRGGSPGPAPRRDPRDARIERLERDGAEPIGDRNRRNGTAGPRTGPGLPPDETARVPETRFGLRVTRGGLVRLLRRTADAAAPGCAALRARIRRGPVVTPDETGRRADAARHRPRAFATPETNQV